MTAYTMHESGEILTNQFSEYSQIRSETCRNVNKVCYEMFFFNYKKWNSIFDILRHVILDAMDKDLCDAFFSLWWIVILSRVQFVNETQFSNILFVRNTLHSPNS